MRRAAAVVLLSARSCGCFPLATSLVSTSGRNVWQSCGGGPASTSSAYPSSGAHHSFSSAAAAVDPAKIRNFAIIAHIDHGKTTLMDRLLSHCGAGGTGEDRVMDSNVIEKERGITILAKYTSFAYEGHTINALDTPGHADFGGEVERVLGMVDGAVLLVDATEGPLAQTKFVLEKALRRGLRPILVLNKVDRESATPERCGQVASQLFDLFASLGASDEQLDFPVLYASAKQGWACTTQPVGGIAPPDASMEPLLRAIVSHVTPPCLPVDQPFAMCVSMIERDPYVGRIAVGRVAAGKARVGDKLRVLHSDGRISDETRVLKIMKRSGLDKILVDVAVAGDVVAVAGAPSAGIADTVADPSVVVPLDPGHIDPPTLSMIFGSNDSPLAGRAGKAVTGRLIGERLLAEAETSVSLKVAAVPGGSDKYEVQARGELQLSILIENMRREGVELAVSPPRVLLRTGSDGVVTEPIEDVMCEVADEVAGAVIEALGLRRGELLDMQPMQGGKQRLTFTVPSRGMIGFKSVFVNLTRGEGIMSRAFLKYEELKGVLDGLRKGRMICSADGKATAHALNDLQSRGAFFIEPGTDVYNGMIIGEHNRDSDLEVNVTREKKLTNIRTVVADDKVSLAAPRQMQLEDAIGFVASDELIEVTPKALRLRKEVLDPGQRKVLASRAKQERIREALAAAG